MSLLNLLDHRQRMAKEYHDKGCRRRWQNWPDKSWQNVIEGSNVCGLAQTWHGGGDLRRTKCTSLLFLRNFVGLAHSDEAEDWGSHHICRLELSALTKTISTTIP